MDKEFEANITERSEGRKMTYVKPAVISEKIFETTALACGKIGGQNARCNQVPKAS